MLCEDVEEASCVRGILKLFFQTTKTAKTFHEQCELRIYFPIQLTMFSLTMMSKCGIVTRSLPRNPLALLVRSGRKMKVFFISKLTESSSSLSSRSYFSFHSLGVFHSMNVSCESKYTYKKSEWKNQLNLCYGPTHIRGVCWVNSMCVETNKS